MSEPKEVYWIDEGEEVGCYFCIEQGDHRSYRRGEAFLAGADHSPYDGNANYVCRPHLDADAVIVQPPLRASAPEPKPK